MNSSTIVSIIYLTNSNGLRRPFQLLKDQLNAKAEAVQIILIGIDNDIYSTVDACPNACEMWKAIKRLKQGESINVQDLKTNLYWEFGKFTSRDVNVQFLLQLQPEWQRFVTLVKHSQELKTISYYKIYDIMKQHKNEVNEIRAERLAHTANPLALVAQQQLEKEIWIISRALISLSFKKIYKPTNNNLRTSSNTSRAYQDNSPRINRVIGYDNQRTVNVAGARENVARECQKLKLAKDAAYHKEKMLLYQELEAHYIYMAQIPEVTLDAADNFGPIFDAEPLQKAQNNNDNYNVFAFESKHLEKPESINDTYLVEQDEHNIIIDSLDMSYDREQDDQDDNDDLAKEHNLLASLIAKLKCEINDSKNHNKYLETSNKALVDKLKGEIEDFKTKNKSLESSNNHFKEANNELSKTNKLMFKDLKKFQDELEKRHDVTNMSKVELDYAKAKTELMSYKTESQKSINNYSYQINDLNQKIFDMKKELVAHQETISIM
ncbi:hypothetical protein Tco_1138340 [Tanacetum coccineum]